METVLTTYNIHSKIRYIITDNAANMKKAFSAVFSGVQEENDIDDPELWFDCTAYDTVSLEKCLAYAENLHAFVTELISND